MWWRIKRSVRNVLREQCGLDVSLVRRGGFPYDFDAEHVEIARRVAPYTMTPVERVYGLIEAVKYLVRLNVHGALVECGVYRGGSMMAAALALLRAGCKDRDLYLFDTFEGMTPPTAHDVDCWGRRPTRVDTWAKAPLDEVRAAMATTQYPPERVHFVKGDVLATLPRSAPPRIALLRLDTDFYDSTRHELVHLYPRLVQGGVLIVDDYGQYRGARRAVDEYFADGGPLLNRMDFAGRIGVKAAPSGLMSDAV